MSVRIFHLAVFAIILNFASLSHAGALFDSGHWQSIARSPMTTVPGASSDISLTVSGSKVTVNFNFYDAKNPDPVMNLKLMGAYTLTPAPTSGKILNMEIKPSSYALSITHPSPVTDRFDLGSCAKVGAPVDLLRNPCGKIKTRAAFYYATVVRLDDGNVLLLSVPLTEWQGKGPADKQASLIPLKKQ